MAEDTDLHKTTGRIISRIILNDHWASAVIQLFLKNKIINKEFTSATRGGLFWMNHVTYGAKIATFLIGTKHKIHIFDVAICHWKRRKAHEFQEIVIFCF